MRKELLILGMTLALLGTPKTVTAAKVFDVTLVACSTLGLSTLGLPVCFGGGGALTLQKGTVEVDDDGEVRLSMKGIEGTTAIEVRPPYTLGLLFFTVRTTDVMTSISISPVGAFTTDENGNFTGVVGSLSGSGPALGFFVINSQGTDQSFIHFDSGARQQFVTAIPPRTLP